MSEIDTSTIASVLRMNDMRIGDNPSFSETQGRGGFIIGAVCEGYLKCEVVVQIEACYKDNDPVFVVPWTVFQERKRRLCCTKGKEGCGSCEVGKSKLVRKNAEML